MTVERGSPPTARELVRLRLRWVRKPLFRRLPSLFGTTGTGVLDGQKGNKHEAVVISANHISLFQNMCRC